MNLATVGRGSGNHVNSDNHDVARDCEGDGEGKEELTPEVLRIRNGLSASSRASRRLIRSTSPITTKRNIKHDIMIMERITNAALITARERSIRRTPRSRVRFTVSDILRDRRPREEIDVDGIGLPFHCVDPACAHVELVSVTRFVVHGEVAAGVRAVFALAGLANKAAGGLHGVLDDVAGGSRCAR